MTNEILCPKTMCNQRMRIREGQKRAACPKCKSIFDVAKAESLNEQIFPNALPVLTVEDIKESLLQIMNAAKSDEDGAHGLENALYEEVLRHIASGDPGDSHKLLAEAALESKKIDFARHCA